MEGEKITPGYLCYIGKSGKKTWIYMVVEMLEERNTLCMPGDEKRVYQYGRALWRSQKPGHVFPCDFVGESKVQWNKTASPLHALWCLDTKAKMQWDIERARCVAHADVETAKKDFNRRHTYTNMTLQEIRLAYIGLNAAGRRALLSRVLEIICR